jgi:acetylornithine aminotransferase
VARAIAEQAGTLVHTSNIYGIGLQQKLAERLTALSGMDNVFFCNSGAEANEAAIKLARMYAHQRSIDNPAIVVMENSFHGRTLATLSATGNRKVQIGFEPLVSGFIRVPYGDLKAIEAAARQHPNIVAVLVEPAQGEGGVNIPREDYLPGIRALCDQHNWLMMLDEVQTGMGRTGKWFAFQHTGIQPDVMTLAKALGNGVPIGACLAHGKAAGLFQPGNHATTFGGNPLACRAALAVLEVMERDKLPARAATLGARLVDKFKTALTGNPHVVQVRGKGLLLGIELDRPCTELVKIALTKQLLINVTADRVIRLLPPLITSDADAERIVETLVPLIHDFTGKP